MEPIRQMCSYAREDRPLMMSLHEHFSALRREKLIVHWWDREIEPGGQWKGIVDEHLNTAQIILFLVSPSFLASDYCYDDEVKRAMERQQTDECKVIPVILRPCVWEIAPFGELQALPDGAKAITMWRPRDLGFKSVVDGVQKVALDVCRKTETVNATPQSAPTVGPKPERPSSESLVKLSVRGTYSNKKAQHAQPWREIGQCRFLRDFKVAADPVFDLVVENRSGGSLLLLKTGIRILQRKPGTGGVMGYAQPIKVEAEYSVHCYEEWKRFNLNDNEVWKSFEDPMSMEKDDSPFRFTLCLENFCDTENASSSEIRFRLQTSSGTVESESIWLEQ
jgi:hypothetical protein